MNRMMDRTMTNKTKRKKPSRVSANDMEFGDVQYHIGLSKGDLAESVILCGEIERAESTARFFDFVRLRKKRREFVTITGTYRGVPVSVMGTGIGPDNTEIAVVEGLRILNPRNTIIVRVGSCGSIQKHVKLGDAVITTASLRLENSSLYYVPEGYPAVADFDVVRALVRSAEKIGGRRYHVGMTATTSSFYGAQCRCVGFPIRYPNLIHELTNLGILNMEMETSMLFTLSGLAGAKAGAICSAYTDRIHDTVINQEEKPKSDEFCIKTALDAVRFLRTEKRV